MMMMMMRRRRRRRMLAQKTPKRRTRGKASEVHHRYRTIRMKNCW
jgi:hypothetical protein